MTFLSFSLPILFRAQSNGTLVATCSSLPILAAGHDADALAEELVRALRSVVATVEKMEIAAAQEYLKAHGVVSSCKTGNAAPVGFDHKRLRKQIREWAATAFGEPRTVELPLAAA